MFSICLPLKKEILTPSPILVLAKFTLVKEHRLAIDVSESNVLALRADSNRRRGPVILNSPSGHVVTLALYDCK